MPEITVDMSVTFDPRKNWCESAMLGAGTSYWARDIEVTDDGITLIDHVENRTRAATWQNIADAIVLIASGRYVRHTGETAPLNDAYTVQAARDLVHRPDEADWDADFDDLVLQQAAIGRSLYG